MSHLYVNCAVPLIEIHGHDNLIVNKDALNLLKSIPEKVCIVAVAGLYRTGKSSLLNWLLGRNAGFTVGPSINRCTRGLWIWGTPLEGKLSTGEKCAVIILDTEGIGGVEGDAKYDARIFSLAILLCSTLVYNSLGSIDETAISNLSFIAQLSNHIKITSSNPNAKDDEEDAAEFFKIFPSFIWVVRDFALQLVDTDGDPITPTQYLNSALEQTSGYDKATMERNRIRSMLAAFFPERACVTLVRPISDENALQQVDLIPYEQLRDDFRSSMDTLKEVVFGHLQPKAIDNKPLTGPMFAGLVLAYVSAVNAGGVPTISSAWEGVSQQECLDAKDNSLASYNTQMASLFHSDNLPVEEEELRLGYAKCLAAALAAYKQRAVGSTARDVMDRLQEDIDASFSHSLQSNRDRSTAFCSAVISEIYDASIRLKLNSTPASLLLYASDMSALRQDWDQLFTDYNLQCRGPSKWEVLANFSRSRMIDCTQAILSAVKNSYESALVQERELTQEKSKQLSAKEAENAVVSDKLQRIELSLREVESANSDLVAKCASSEVSVQDLTRLKRQAERSYEEEKDVRTRYEAKNSALSDRVKQLEGVETQCFELRGERDAHALRITELQEEIERMHAEKKKKCTVS
jgi:hypothetical protein